MKRMIICGALMVGFVAVMAQPSYATDAKKQYKACLNNCYITTAPWTPQRAKCISQCNLDYLAAATAGEQDFAFRVTSPAIQTRFEGIAKLVMKNPNQPITLTIINQAAETLNSVDAYLSDDNNAEMEPEDGIFLGTAHAGNDWKITFTPQNVQTGTCSGGSNDGGPCASDSQCPGGGACSTQFNPDVSSGFVWLVGDYGVTASGPALKDIQALMQGTLPVIPTVSEWGLVVLALLLLAVATLIIRSRKAELVT